VTSVLTSASCLRCIARWAYRKLVPLMTTTRDTLPRIAIVGRPNVGKSTLLNRMCGSRVAIVEPTAGVTRDRIAVASRLRSTAGERWYEVIDTGGIGIVDRDDLGPHVESQVKAALSHAELVLFLVDVRDGLTPLDNEVAKLLRGADVPVLLVINKTEGSALEWDIDAFHGLGVGEAQFPISAQNGGGLTDLYDEIAYQLPDAPHEKLGDEPVMKLAVIGRRNAGKSTMINRLAREERMIVSEVPGTTRDSVDVVFERDGESFVAIDTAGVRKKKSLEDAIEYYSDARSHKTIRRADVVLLMFDASEKLAAIEKTLARYAIDHYKPLVIVANKWDLVPDFNAEDYKEYLRSELPGISFAPVQLMSAKNGQFVDEALTLARDLFEQCRLRVSTGELNRVLTRALAARSPSSRGYGVRLRYATQAESTPPTFVLFVNDRKLIGKSYLRYLQNRLREELPFKQVPLRIILRDKYTEREGESLE